MLLVYKLGDNETPEVTVNERLYRKSFVLSKSINDPAQIQKAFNIIRAKILPEIVDITNEDNNLHKGDVAKT